MNAELLADNIEKLMEGMLIHSRDKQDLEQMLLATITSSFAKPIVDGLNSRTILPEEVIAQLLVTIAMQEAVAFSSSMPIEELVALRASVKDAMKV